MWALGDGFEPIIVRLSRRPLSLSYPRMERKLSGNRKDKSFVVQEGIEPSRALKQLGYSQFRLHSGLLHHMSCICFVLKS